MPFKLPENVQETTTTTGTGTVTLNGAVSGAYPLSSQLSNGDTTFYVITDGVDIEVGVGTYSNTSGQQLARTTVIYSTNGNARVNWGAGTRDVIVGLPGDAVASLLDPAMAAGILVKTADRTYTARQIDVDTDDLQIANETGVAGNPTLALAFTVTAYIKTLLATTADAGACAAIGALQNLLTTQGDVIRAGSGGTPERYANGLAAHGQCRLELSGGNLLLMPRNGNRILINGVQYKIPAAGSATLSASGLSAGTNYYIYVYDNSGTLTLEADTTVPAVDATHGVMIKTGNATRTLVGLVRPVTGPAFANSVTQRLVRSWFNDPGISAFHEASTSPTRASSSYGAVSITEFRLEFITWDGEFVDVFFNGTATVSADNVIVFSKLYLDGSPLPGNAQHSRGGNSSQATMGHSVASKASTTEGYHYLDLYGKSDSGDSCSWNNTSIIGAKTSGH